MNTVPVEQALWEPEYPESDGKPMAETDTHRREMINAILTLQDRFEDDDEVYVAGNLLLYFEKGNPAASIAPDTFFVRGVPKGERRTYKLWEERKAPQLAIEFSSRSTRKEDRTTKRDIYYRIGIQEYFLVDPLEEYLKPPLQGFRRGEHAFATILPGKEGALYSQVLDLWLTRKGDALRFVDPESNEILPTPMEKAKLESERASRESERASRESERAGQEAERASQEAERARLESERASQEAQRAQEETLARRAAEEEITRLRALLEKAGISAAS